MSVPHKVTISVPEEVAQAMDAALDSGEYTSVDEIVDTALRRWFVAKSEEAEETARLRAAIALADASGPSMPADEVYARLRERIAKRQAA